MVSGDSPIVRPQALLTCAAAVMALSLGACSCDDGDPWRATYINTAEAATEADRVAAVEPPACNVEKSASVEKSAESSGTHVDPNLVEIARLEVERDCYKGAEESLRQRLEGGVGASAVLK
jgi:hypothetical protein